MAAPYTRLRFAGILVTIWCGLRGWPKDQLLSLLLLSGAALIV
jgi:hypothetical protein